jgi:hypothetical protein
VTNPRGRGLPAPPVLPPRTKADSDVDIPVDVDLDWDDESDAGAHPETVDWSEPFVDQLEVANGVKLPPEPVLLRSLENTPRESLIPQDAMWNITVCVAFGSDQLARTAAKALFEAVQITGAVPRLEWIARVLLSKGFMPSGIPSEAGLRGVRVLRETCPTDLRVALESAVLR